MKVYISNFSSQTENLTTVHQNSYLAAINRAEELLSSFYK